VNLTLLQLIFVNLAIEEKPKLLPADRYFNPENVPNFMQNLPGHEGPS